MNSRPIPHDATAAEPGGVGHSSLSDPEAAGCEAVMAALGGGSPGAGDVVFVFVFPESRYDLDALYGAAREAAAPATVVGVTHAGAFTHDAQVDDGCVAAWLAAGEASIGVCHVAGAGADTAAAARRVAENARERAGERYEHSVLLVLSDGLASDPRDVVRGTYEVTGATVPLIGGAAGDSLRFERTSQLGPLGVTSNGIVGVWINSSRPLGVGVGHGWDPVGPPMVVTSAQGRVVYELDGRPAAQAYLDALGNPEGDGQSFTLQVIDHPLGLSAPSGRHDVRHVLSRDGDSLVMLAQVPDQAAVRVMTSDTAGLLQGARDAAQDAQRQLDRPARGALVFSCAARLRLLGADRANEARVISEALGGVPLAGFFTYGEFARYVGSTGFHNATVALLAL